VISGCLTHRRNPQDWVSATAVFSGKCGKATIRTKLGPRAAKYNAYEIVYDVNGKSQSGWYSFYPLEDPDPQELAGTTMQIRYRKGKPYIFEKECL